MKNTISYVLLGLLNLGGLAQATCNPNIPLTRPDSRYEAVAGATPAGSEVRDKVTGLIWQRCVMGMVWSGTTCTGTASTYTWQQALDTAHSAPVSTAATGAVAAWRVPNYAELYNLVERACHAPAINTTWFSNTPMNMTWSSSTDVRSAGSAWLVPFFNGSAEAYEKSSAYAVRLVRSSQ